MIMEIFLNLIYIINWTKIQKFTILKILNKKSDFDMAGIILGSESLIKLKWRTHQLWTGLTTFFFFFLPRSTLWIWGITPPPGIVAFMRESSSSSPLMASYKCLGVILLTLKSFEAFPASSSTSAVKYSRIADVYTAAVAPTLFFYGTRYFRYLWILPTGNYTM